MDYDIKDSYYLDQITVEKIPDIIEDVSYGFFGNTTYSTGIDYIDNELMMMAMYKQAKYHQNRIEITINKNMSGKYPATLLGFPITFSPDINCNRSVYDELYNNGWDDGIDRSEKE